MKPLIRAAVIFALVALGSCQTAWYSYRFVPAPLEVRLDSPTDADAQGRALVTVLGIRKANAKEGRAAARVELRMRLENFGHKPMSVEPDSFTLVAASLETFGAPEFVDPPKEPLAQGQNAVFEVCFPLPSGKQPSDLGLSGLNLKWNVSYAGERVGTGVTFERAPDAYYHSYWYDDPFYDPWCVHTHFSIVGHMRDD